MYNCVLYKKRSELMEGRATVIIYCSPPPLSTPADQAEVSIQHSLHNAIVLPWIDSSSLPGFQVSYQCQNGLKKTLFFVHFRQ